MARVTKDTTIGEVIQIDAGVIPILMGAGMHCVGCPYRKSCIQWLVLTLWT